MAQALYPPSRPLTVPEILDLGFEIFRNTILKCLHYSVCAFIASQLMNIYALARGRAPGQVDARNPAWWVLYALAILLSSFLWYAMLIRQHALASGQPTAFLPEIRQVLQRLPAALGMGLIVFLGICALIIPVAFAWGMTVRELTRPGALLQLPAAAVVVILILMIPVVYLVVGVALASPAVVLDRLGPWQSLRKGFNLAYGSWWRTIAIFAVAVVAIVVLYMAAMFVMGIVTGVLAVGGVRDATVMAALLLLGVGLAGTFAWPLMLAVLLATYGELNVRREGVDLSARIGRLAES